MPDYAELLTKAAKWFAPDTAAAVRAVPSATERAVAALRAPKAPGGDYDAALNNAIGKNAAATYYPHVNSDAGILTRDQALTPSLPQLQLKGAKPTLKWSDAGAQGDGDPWDNALELARDHLMANTTPDMQVAIEQLSHDMFNKPAAALDPGEAGELFNHPAYDAILNYHAQLHAANFLELHEPRGNGDFDFSGYQRIAPVDKAADPDDPNTPRYFESVLRDPQAPYGPALKDYLPSSYHFDDPNQLAHVRGTVMPDAQGAHLYAEELQSDPLDLTERGTVADPSFSAYMKTAMKNPHALIANSLLQRAADNPDVASVNFPTASNILSVRSKSQGMQGFAKGVYGNELGDNVYQPLSRLGFDPSSIDDNWVRYNLNGDDGDALRQYLQTAPVKYADGGSVKLDDNPSWVDAFNAEPAHARMAAMYGPRAIPARLTAPSHLGRTPAPIVPPADPNGYRTLTGGALPSAADVAGALKRYGRGVAAGVVGLPGDLASLLHVISDKLPASTLPTSDDVDVSAGGDPNDPNEGLGTFVGGFVAGPGEAKALLSKYAKPALRAIKPLVVPAAAAAGAAGALSPEDSALVDALVPQGYATGGRVAKDVPPEFSSYEDYYGLPPGLLSAVERTESNHNGAAVSPKGAQGWFQFMPATARELGVDPGDRLSAAEGAARYLSELRQQFGGDLTSALAAWNWGPGNLKKKGIDDAPAETKGFVTKVLGHMDGQPAAEPERVAQAGKPVVQSAGAAPSADDLAMLEEELSRDPEFAQLLGLDAPTTQQQEAS